MELLERDDALAQLLGALAEARAGRGMLAVVGGEAGIGKTSLVRRLTQEAGDARVLWGGCDDLAVPRPLGPFHDMAAGGAVRVGAHLGDGDRSGIFAAVMAELGERAPTVCVIEDAHWADIATIDVLTFVARRIADVPALVVVTVREDELAADHPLRRALGAAPGAHSRRLSLSRLSADAVRRLAGRGDAARLYGLTAGNPFLVTEMLSAGHGGGTPGGVRDAVLSRVARLGAGARHALEVVSVIPARAERDLLDAVAGDAAPTLAECEAVGLLVSEPGAVRFRHELARLAVEETLPGSRRIELNRLVLRALETCDADPARLAHHAERAEDPAAVTRHGLRAARAAARAASHREASALYRRVLAHGAPLPDTERAEVLDEASEQAYHANEPDRATETRERAVGLRRALGEPRALCMSLVGLSRTRWWIGDRVGSEAAADEAVAVVRELPPTRELARAESNLSQLLMLTQRDAEAIAWGERALTLARSLDDTEVIVHAMTNVGTSLMRTDYDAGRDTLERAIVLGRDAGLVDHVCRAMINVAWDAIEFGRHAEGRALAERGLAYSREHEMWGYADYLVTMLARVEMTMGAWDAARARLDGLLEGSGFQFVVGRIPALEVLGLVGLRRGDARAARHLDDAWELARETRELQRLRPIACARGEAGWLAGDAAAVDAATAETYELALERGHAWDLGELAVWRHRAGLLQTPPPGCAEPYALEMAGDWRAAAEWWGRLEAPYARAVAQLAGDDPAALTEALEVLDGLGATATAALARARLRELGVARVPRGPRPGTRANPAGLSARQLEIARLAAQGLTNPQIAARLVLSDRTVEHHVAAAVGKLGVADRTGIAAALRAHGAEAGGATAPT